MPSCSLSLALYASALLLPWLIDWRAFVPPPGVLFNHNKVLTQTGADGKSKENTDDVMSAEEREWRERKNRINAREKRDRIEREERHLQISNDAKRSATHKNSARSSSLKKMHDQERREFKRRAFVNPGEMKASSYRYLRYENCPTNGINHQYANLLAMIEDAVMLDRIAVIPKPCLTPIHNFHKEGEGEQWSAYRDLDLTAITVEEDDFIADAMEPVEGRLRFVFEDDFYKDDETDGDSLSYENDNEDNERLDEESHVGAGDEIGESETLRTTWKTVIRGGAKRWRLVVRDMAGVPGGLYRRRTQVPLEGTTIRITVPQSRRIRRVADKAIMVLGDQSYIAVHVRRGDRLKQWKYRRGRKGCPNGGSLREDTDPVNITKTILRIIGDEVAASGRSMAHAKPTVYVMSDESKEGFFAPLESAFTLRLYTFLQPMIELRLIDNYALYEVEKAIFNAAGIKIHTFASVARGHKFSLTACIGHS